MSRRTTRRCAWIQSEADVERLQADGAIDQGDAEALLDFLAFLRGEISAAELDERATS